MPGCAVFGCNNNNKTTKGMNIKYFKFRNNEFSRQWVIACGRKDWINLKNATICSVHFESDCFEVNSVRMRLSSYTAAQHMITLKPDAVPTLNLPVYKKRINSERSCRLNKRRRLNCTTSSRADKTNTEFNESAGNKQIVELQQKNTALEKDHIISKLQTFLSPGHINMTLNPGTKCTRWSPEDIASAENQSVSYLQEPEEDLINDDTQKIYQKNCLEKNISLQSQMKAENSNKNDKAFLNKMNENPNIIFGEYIASKLEEYDSHCRSTVQHLINNILNDADMGKYDQLSSHSFSSSEISSYQQSSHSSHSQPLPNSLNLTSPNLEAQLKEQDDDSNDQKPIMTFKIEMDEFCDPPIIT